MWGPTGRAPTSRSTNKQASAEREHVERGDGPLEPLQRELDCRLHLDVLVDLRVETLRDQDLPARRLLGNSRGEAVVPSPAATIS
jgi:hypothetical protein